MVTPVHSIRIWASRRETFRASTKTGVTGHVLDPSQTPRYKSAIAGKRHDVQDGVRLHVPFRLKEHFVRAKFKDVDSSLWAPRAVRRVATVSRPATTSHDA